MYSVLLSIHIAAGVTALVAAAGALATSKGGRWHVYAGRAFALAMLVVFLTALPMTFLRPNLFLFLVAVFSFYLALTGWCRARNRGSTSGRAEWIAAIIMTVAALGMGIRGIMLIVAGDSMGIVLLAFGGGGGFFAISDLYAFRTGQYHGTLRIATHLTRMLAGTIAAVTAFVTVNVHVEPAFVVWLAPTVVLTPVIVSWNFRVRREAGRDEPA